MRGKARCNVEFGAKISISVTGAGFTFLDRLSFAPYNEGEDLKPQARAYRRRHSHYPKSDPELLAEDKRQFLDDQRQRNAVESKIGQGKRRF